MTLSVFILPMEKTASNDKRMLSASRQGARDRHGRVRYRTRPVACHRCHARKVKCSGDQPCQGCRRSNNESNCTYPSNHRLVEVSETYLNELVAENRRLHSKGNECESEVVEPLPPRRRHTTPVPVPVEPSTEHQINAPLAQEPWFVAMNVLHAPILVAEASDSAFASRLRQVLSADRATQHLPRVNYPTEELLSSLKGVELVWPDASRARLLVSAAIKCLGRCYHVVRPSEISTDLEQSFRFGEELSSLQRSRLLAVFAIGEMYTTRIPVTEQSFPGLAYFAHSMESTTPTVERPSLILVEIHLLLVCTLGITTWHRKDLPLLLMRWPQSYYALSVNRRHSAYTLAASAIHLAVIMGLHLPISPCLLADQRLREHRTRLWWTAYTFDRMWAAKLGYPACISDAELEVGLPSNPSPVEIGEDDFQDCDSLIARIDLARLCGRLVGSIYGKKEQPPTSLYHRVQKAFGELRAWTDALSTSLRIVSSVPDPRAVSLRLLFNQLVILVTRPILLHVLRSQCSQHSEHKKNHIPAIAHTLSEACVSHARNSSQLLTDSWANGSFMIFDYSYTQYTFSCAIILVISHLLQYRQGDSGTQTSDLGDFRCLCHLLMQLKSSGNYEAAEFCAHVDAIEEMLAEHTTTATEQVNPALGILPHSSSLGDSTTNKASSVTIQPDTQVGFPDIPDFQALSDLQFIDDSIYSNDLGLYWCNDLY